MITFCKHENTLTFMERLTSWTLIYEYATEYLTRSTKTTTVCCDLKKKSVEINSERVNVIEKRVQVGKDQEKAQSEKDSHSKNRGGKNQTIKQSGTYTMKHIVSRMSSYFPNRWPLSYLN